MRPMTWISFLGQKTPDLEAKLAETRGAAIRAGLISEKELGHIAGLKPSVVEGELRVNDVVLEKLRTLCMSWDIDIKPREISSHRRFIGPVIVAVKKMFYPILRAMLFNTIQAQRHFNGTVISVLSEIANDKSKSSSSSLRS